MIIEAKPTILALWNNLFSESRARGNPEQYFQELNTLYSAEGRYYHNFAHVQDCLNEFGDVSGIGTFPLEVQYALWYHDAIYDTYASDNEEKSAELAGKYLKKMGFEAPFRTRVQDFILATKHSERNIPGNLDTQLVVDIDLSILGRPQEEFDTYESNIRREYGWVPEALFRSKREEILRRFR